MHALERKLRLGADEAESRVVHEKRRGPRPRPRSRSRRRRDPPAVPRSATRNSAVPPLAAFSSAASVSSASFERATRSRRLSLRRERPRERGADPRRRPGDDGEAAGSVIASSPSGARPRRRGSREGSASRARGRRGPPAARTSAAEAPRGRAPETLPSRTVYAANQSRAASAGTVTSAPSTRRANAAGGPAVQTPGRPDGGRAERSIARRRSVAPGSRSEGADAASGTDALPPPLSSRAGVRRDPERRRPRDRRVALGPEAREEQLRRGPEVRKGQRPADLARLVDGLDRRLGRRAARAHSPARAPSPRGGARTRAFRRAPAPSTSGGVFRARRRGPPPRGARGPGTSSPSTPGQVRHERQAGGRGQAGFRRRGRAGWSGPPASASRPCGRHPQRGGDRREEGGGGAAREAHRVSGSRRRSGARPCGIG